MQVTFDLNDAASARDACAAISRLFNLSGGQPAAARTTRAAPANPAALAGYNTLAAAAGAAAILDRDAAAAAAILTEDPVAPAPESAPEPEPEPALNPPAAPNSPADAESIKQDALVKLRPLCVKAGAAWLKREVLDPAKVDRLSLLSAEQAVAAVEAAEILVASL